ncbi:MAG: EAL domain-containing protein [Candidatus Nanopelagicales bacterium]
MQVPGGLVSLARRRARMFPFALLLLLLVVLPPFLPGASERRSASLVSCVVLAAIVLRTTGKAWQQQRTTRAGWLFMLVGMALLLVHDFAEVGSPIVHSPIAGSLFLQMLGYVAFAVAGLTWSHVRSWRTILQGVDAGIIAVAVGMTLWVVTLFNTRRSLDGDVVWLSALLATFAGFAVASFATLVFSDRQRRGKAALILTGIIALAASDIQALAVSLAGSAAPTRAYQFGTLLGYALIAIAAASVFAEMEASREPVALRRLGRFESWAEFTFVVMAMATPPFTGFTLDLLTDSGVTPAVHAAAHLVSESGSAVLLALVATRMLIVRRTGISTLDRLMHMSRATESAQDGIVILDRNNLVLEVHAGFSSLYGWSADELVGRDLRILDHGDQPEAFWETVQAAVEKYGTWTGQVQNRDKLARAIPVRLTFSAVLDDLGRLVGYTQVHHDLRSEMDLASVAQRLDQEHEGHAAAQTIATSELPLQDALDAACRLLVSKPEIASAFVCALRDGDYEVLAVAGALAASIQPGHSLPVHMGDAVVATVHAHPVLLPWRETPRGAAATPWDQFAQAGSGTGLPLIAFAPVRVGDALVAVIGVCNRDATPASSLVSVMPALGAFSSTLAVQVGPAIERRMARKQEVLAVSNLIAEHDFQTVFQPICDLLTGTPVGYEALTRFPSAAPDVMFAQAAALGVGLDLEVATVNAALEAARALPDGRYLSLNASPDLIASRFLHARLAGVPRELVVELTEHDAVNRYGDLRALLDDLRPLARIAVDDTGSGYSSLQHLVELAPDVIKVDIALVRDIDSNPARQAMVNAVTAFAQRIGASVVAEGIETAVQREALLALGLSFGQGFLLGRPEPIHR